MDWRHRGRDRRSSPRFDVVGRLWGSAISAQQATVRNIGAGGVLVESSWPLPIDARVALRLPSSLTGAHVATRIRHVQLQEGPIHLVGLEFSSADAALLDEIAGVPRATD